MNEMSKANVPQAKPPQLEHRPAAEFAKLGQVAKQKDKEAWSK